jgi:glycosyltransferase involved in cell wall biosynthesis
MQSKEQPLISIIMNCYNGEKYLKQSIASVLHQTYQNWELIFWDNQSEDESAKIFKSYNDKRLKYYFGPNHTFLYEARNEAIKKTSGKFIAFLDTDDFWEKDKLELQVPLFENIEVGVVYGNHYILNQKLNTKKIFLKKKPKGFILDDLLKSYCTSLLTLIIRKSFLDKYKPPFDNSFHIMGDFDLMIRMSTKYKFDCVDKPIATARIHEKNQSLLKKNRQVIELKLWHIKMNKYPEIINNKNYSNIGNIINNLEIINFLMERDFKNAKILIQKMPYSFKKLKYMLALILPNNLVRKFIQS